LRLCNVFGRGQQWIFALLQFWSHGALDLLSFVLSHQTLARRLQEYAAVSAAVKAGAVAGVKATPEDELKQLFGQIDPATLDRLRTFVAERAAATSAEPAPATEAAPVEATPVESAVEKKVESAPDAAAAGGLTPEQQENLRTTFDAIDTDKSGFIEAGELIRAVKILMQSRGKEISDEIAESLFNEIDTDKNKKIDFDEYTAMIVQMISGN